LLGEGVPGSLTFADQMISSTPGLIPQSTCSLTKCRYRAATILIDSFSDYTHVSLLEDLSMDSTLDSKLDFEHRALTFGVTVKVIMLTMVALPMQLGVTPVML
jgi:hypothetical protein